MVCLLRWDENKGGEYLLLLYLDVVEGIGKRFRVINDQHFYFLCEGR